MPFLDMTDPAMRYSPTALVASLQEPGHYFCLSCSCGVADDVGFFDLVEVSWPLQNEIVWSLLTGRNADALLPDVVAAAHGVQWRFDRAVYAKQVTKMIRLIQTRWESVCQPGELPEGWLLEDWNGRDVSGELPEQCVMIFDILSCDGGSVEAEQALLDLDISQLK